MQFFVVFERFQMGHTFGLRPAATARRAGVLRATVAIWCGPRRPEGIEPLPSNKLTRPSPATTPKLVRLPVQCAHGDHELAVRGILAEVLENIALKLVLEHREVRNWRKLLDHLMADKEILAGVRLKFREVYRDIEGNRDPSAALDTAPGRPASSEKAA